MKRRHGTGFLVNPCFDTKSFNPISPRVSWVKVRAKVDPGSHRAAGASSICFVNGYAPTETNSSIVDVEDFYRDLTQALQEARKVAGCDGVVVRGDFNVHLGDDCNFSEHGVLGACLPPGPSSRNSHLLVEFCEREKLAISQTFQNRGKLGKTDGWATWRHPGSGRPHLKDHILVPRWEVKNVECWPAQEIDIGSDHAMVICQLNRREGLLAGVKRKVEKRAFAQGSCEQPNSSKVSIRAKLRRLDLHPPPDKGLEHMYLAWGMN